MPVWSDGELEAQRVRFDASRSEACPVVGHSLQARYWRAAARAGSDQWEGNCNGQAESDAGYLLRAFLERKDRKSVV